MKYIEGTLNGPMKWFVISQLWSAYSLATI